MKKKLLFIVIIFTTFSIKAQSGNDINDAIDVNGTNVSVSLIDFNSATKSGLLPECVDEIDVFYKHTVSSGENKVVIGMASVGVFLSTDFDYQILLAPAGNTTNLQEITCSSFNVPILASGSFEQIINNVNVNDVYYLRVYKPSGFLSSVLSDLLSATVVSMTSEYDATLSIENTQQNNFKISIKDNTILFHNNLNYNRFYIYSLDGKKIMSNKSNQTLEAIDISFLNKGLYVLKLENEIDIKAIKFIKQ